jgi:hypothetical protein
LAGLGKQGSKGRTDRSAFVRRRSSRVRGIASDVGPRPQESSRHTGRAPVELAPLYAAALTPSKGRLIPLHHAAISRKRSPTNSPACRGRRTFRPGSLAGTGRAALSRATITPGRWVFLLVPPSLGRRYPSPPTSAPLTLAGTCPKSQLGRWLSATAPTLGSAALSDDERNLDQPPGAGSSGDLTVCTFSWSRIRLTSATG